MTVVSRGHEKIARRRQASKAGQRAGYLGGNVFKCSPRTTPAIRGAKKAFLQRKTLLFVR